MLTTKNNRLIALLVCFTLLLTVIVPLSTITAHADEPTITPGLYYEQYVPHPKSIYGELHSSLCCRVCFR